MDKQKLGKEVRDKLIALTKENKIEEMLKNNYIDFEYENQKYRIKKPSFQTQEKIAYAQMVKYQELLNDKNYLFKKEWIEKYKATPQDINKIDEQVKLKQDNEEKLLLKLATSNGKDAELLEKEIEIVREEIDTLIYKKTNLLSFSIEDVLYRYIKSYTSWMCLFKIAEDKEEQCFETYDEFMNNESELFSKTLYYSELLIQIKKIETNNYV
jgi:hypothetical protein